jgi:Na+:H+ antiporter, NhaA family
LSRYFIRTLIQEPGSADFSFWVIFGIETYLENSSSISKNPQQSIKATAEAILNDSRSIGILLLVCAFFSLLISNLPFGKSWTHFWNDEIHLLHQLRLPHSLLHIANDGFMAIFFFLAGLEIKKEILEGSLSNVQKASLPIVAAIGGMLVPALIFTFFNKGTDFQKGWAIPAATDIAFALGVAALLGKKMPASLRIFLITLAIIDDLGAILIIALFYGEAIRPLAFLAAILAIVFIVLVNRKRKFGWVQWILGLLLWYFFYNSGIHPTIGGIIFAMLVPKDLVKSYEHALFRPVYFIIVPIFALANTAIIIPPQFGELIGSSLSFGIILGLVIGKPLGIFGATFMLTRNSKIDLPLGIHWSHIIGVGLLAGIGFTMSIFIASLAFSEGSQEDLAKIAVLIGSLVSMVSGYLWLNAVRKEKIMV